MKRLSIITTFYNAAQFIEQTLNSVLKQKVPEGCELEYVIVNDLSPDNSQQIVENFMRTHENDLNGNWIMVTPQQNLGCGGARRFGIKNATGDYFMFLDADDYYINSDFCYRAVKDLEDNNADIVEYGVLMHQANGTQNKLVATHKYVIDRNIPHNASLALFKDNLIKFNVWSKIYRRWIVESYEYSDERTFEDVRTIPIWISNAKKICIMPTLEINYRAAANSIIRADMIKTRLGTIRAIASHLERYKDDFPVIKAMYVRSMIDIEQLLNNHSSENEGFNEMSELNTLFLQYLYPTTWQEKVWSPPKTDNITL